MSALDLTEIAAWGLIAAACGYGLAHRLGRPAAVMVATLAALATKSALFGLV